MSDDDNYDADSGTKPGPSTTEPESSSSHAGPADTTADPESLHKVARDFLQDETVKEAPVERKVEYLRQKGLAEDDISRLLEGERAGAETANPSTQDVRHPIVLEQRTTRFEARKLMIIAASCSSPQNIPNREARQIPSNPEPPTTLPPSRPKTRRPS